MCPGWSEANKSLRAESPERKDIMSENVYTIPGLISHVTQEVKQSPTQNQLRLAVTFPDRLMLSSNEQIGVFMDFAACIPDTIATSGKAYCKRCMAPEISYSLFPATAFFIPAKKLRRVLSIRSLASSEISPTPTVLAASEWYPL